MRAPQLRGFALTANQLVGDLFAGGGGASSGIEAALGRAPDFAINHSREAIAVHEANHPNTKHYCEDIWAVDPKVAVGSRKMGILWASPDCTDHSNAKGSAPRSTGRRALADVILRWAREVRPTWIFLENVKEWEDWGPLKNGKRDPDHKGESFRAWFAALKDLGYHGEWRLLTAADYGTPTTRERLFFAANCVGLPIVWPEPTHGKGRTHPWRPASDIIDWDLPCPSIFGRKKALVEKSMNRIASGVRRYVLEDPDPFIVEGHAARGDDQNLSLLAPGEQLTIPWVVKHYGGVVGHGVKRPIGAVTTIDHHALAVCWLTKYYGSSRNGASLRLPLPVVTTGGGKGGGHLALTKAFLVKYYGAGGREHSAQQMLAPLGTITTKDRFGLVTVRGTPYRIDDVGMRFLKKRELFSAQGFDDDYIIDPIFNGKPLTDSAAKVLAGNSVCKQVAEAVVRANVYQTARLAA